MDRVVFYQEADGSCPVIEFFSGHSERVKKITRARIKILAQFGYELRVPILIISGKKSGSYAGE